MSTNDELLDVSVVPDRSEVRVGLAGELEVSTIAALERQVRELYAAGFEQVVIDLRNVTFLDSTGLRVLLALRNDAKRGGHRLALANPRRDVARVFELTATRALFDWR